MRLRTSLCYVTIYLKRKQPPFSRLMKMLKMSHWTFNMHPDLNNLSFKKGTKATVFKFDYYHDSEQSSFNIVVGYSELSIVSGGKVRTRYAYDGSIFEAIFEKRLGDTVDYYVQKPEHRPASESSWRLGEWLIIPNTAITADKPLEYWINVARNEFKAALKCYRDALPQIIKMIEECDFKPLTVQEWNEARLAIMPEWKKERFITKPANQ